MEVLHTIFVAEGRRVDLCLGDLAGLGPDDGIDLVVVSAFPDDYAPTRTSLIGALFRRGVNVSALARSKLMDLRPTTRCWVSSTLDRQAVGFSQLLCFEPDTPAEAPEVVGNVFRALVPLVGGPDGLTTVAMPVLASGDMAQDATAMLTATLTAATEWMAHGLALERLAIVVQDFEAASQARSVFASFTPPSPASDQGPPPDRPFDVFINYARSDGADIAEYVHSEIERLRPSSHVFRDTTAIAVGSSWQQELWDSLDACRRVVSLITPAFLVSKVCQEEFNIALVRQRDSATPILFPLYVRRVDPPDPLPAHLRAFHYIDCCEARLDAVRSACEVLAIQLGDPST